MIIEVTGVSARNKGAQLMFEAVRQYVASLPGPPDIAMAARFGSYQERAGYRLLQKCDASGFSRTNLVLRMMSPSLKRQWGIVQDVDVDCILDASGFAFSDELGLDRVQRFARQVTKWRQQGKKIVLLPQALGPFKGAAIRAEMETVVKGVDLIFARDPQSFAYTRELVESVSPGSDKLRQAPDFTNGLQATVNEDPDWPSRAFCIVPNIRMVEGARRQDADAYRKFLLAGAKAAQRAGLTPVVVLHATTGDEAFVEPLQAGLDGELKVFQEADPLRLKGLLGQAHMILGSRFHALVNGLSQHVPCIACGWSHKYDALFEDYACVENVLPVTTKEESLSAKIMELADASIHTQAVEKLAERADGLKKETHAMWAAVDACLGIDRAPANSQT